MSEKQKKKVYIASPYTLGDTARNVRAQHLAKDALFQLDCIPFMPLLSHYHEIGYPQSWDVWIEWCLAWLPNCDYLLRLPGESKGADREVWAALDNNIIVLETIEKATDALYLLDKDHQTFAHHAGIQTIAMLYSAEFWN